MVRWPRQVLCGDEYDDAKSSLSKIRAVFLQGLGPLGRRAVAAHAPVG